jgi:hypothetical protein
MMFRLIQGIKASLFGSILLATGLLVVLLAPAGSQAQRPRASDGDDAQPAFIEFHGVRIGMPTEEARKKLGTPREKTPEQDFYVFNDTQAVQVMYDKKGAVSAISIDFMNGANSIPSPKEVLGADIEGKPDGSMFKMIRYPKAGYWVSYSRTAGNEATVTIMMQRIDQ